MDLEIVVMGIYGLGREGRRAWLSVMGKGRRGMRWKGLVGAGGMEGKGLGLEGKERVE